MSAPVGFVSSSPGIGDWRRHRRNTRRLVVPSLRRVDAPKTDNLRPNSARTQLGARGLVQPARLDLTSARLAVTFATSRRRRSLVR